VGHQSDIFAPSFLGTDEIHSCTSLHVNHPTISVKSIIIITMDLFLEGKDSCILFTMGKILGKVVFSKNYFQRHIYS
jgi:hypothetical protein